MNLVRNSEHPYRLCRVRCVACHPHAAWIYFKDAWADLDGKPFVDYYCEQHAQEKLDETPRIPMRILW